MKKLVLSMAVFFAICSLLTVALAAKNCETYGRVTVHTGPWDFYTELCTLPSGMAIQAIEFEMSPEDGKLWHLIEFTLGGKLYRGYASADAPIAFESASGYYEADRFEDRICFMLRNTAVYAAPSGYAAIIDDVEADQNVTLLRREGNYILIDYEQYGQPCRGYVSSDSIR